MSKSVSALSEQDIIRIWEIGQARHPIDRALAIVAVVKPSMSWEELTTLPIGLRDSYLLSVRERTFGPQLDSRAQCPACDEPLEFVLNIDDVRVEPLDDDTDGIHETSCDGYELRFRLPNSLDLAAAAGCDDVVIARNLLVQRCVLQVDRCGETIATEDLPESVITVLAEEMSERDAQADVQLNLNCPACGHHWTITFDIVSFFWAEISAQAKRLLYEVHTLAQAYGWREADILSMSATRRHFYLEMVS